MVNDPKHLQRTLQQLFDAQRDDQRLRDHLEGLKGDPAFPGLTWFWGPVLYQRNRAVFRSLIQNQFSDWQSGGTWKRVQWSDHAQQLEAWLAAARETRDTKLVRRLLRWKYGRGWTVDAKGWCASLLSDYRGAKTAASRAIVLDEYDDWFTLDQDAALALYQCDHACSSFVLKHLPQSFWGEDKRQLWERLLHAAADAGDEKLRWELYRKQVPIKQWQAEVLNLAREMTDPQQLNDALQQRHPAGYNLPLVQTMLQLLEARGRDVIPYVRSHLRDVAGGWWRDQAIPLVKLAERRGWWDLWAAAIRAGRDPQLLNSAVAGLLDDSQIAEHERLSRLHALAGVSREWNWPGLGLAQIHSLDDELAARLYRRYPALIHGPFKAHVTPLWWRGYPQLLQAAQQVGDDELIDLLASRYATQVKYEFAYYAAKERDRIIETAETLAEYYQALRDRDPRAFARRAANILTRIPAFAIPSYRQLLKSNQLARLLFVRSFEIYLEDPAAVRDLVEGSDIHVQMLAYRVLAQDDQRARRLAAEMLEILIGTLTRPLHRKTRLAAFDSLANVARADASAASFILQRAREALRLPDKKYPKEQLVGLLGTILHLHPQLRRLSEQPTIYRLQEAGT